MDSIRYFEHPILGVVILRGSSKEGLVSIKFSTNTPEVKPYNDPLLLRVEHLLECYLLGENVDFSTIPLKLNGTPFQKRLWQALCLIPWGETRSYQWIAAQVGKPKAMQAVGQANGRNPIPIIIPCHRVIQKNGQLGGYTGGLHIKNFLLSLEANSQPQSLFREREAPSHSYSSWAMTLL